MDIQDYMREAFEKDVAAARAKREEQVKEEFKDKQPIGDHKMQQDAQRTVDRMAHERLAELNAQDRSILERLYYGDSGEKAGREGTGTGIEHDQTDTASENKSSDRDQILEARKVELRSAWDKRINRDNDRGR